MSLPRPAAGGDPASRVFYKCMERNDFQKTKMRFNGERGGWESYRTVMEQLWNRYPVNYFCE